MDVDLGQRSALSPLIPRSSGRDQQESKYKEKRKTETEMGGLCEERFGRSGSGVDSEGEG